jgi:hypothetical protein
MTSLAERELLLFWRASQVVNRLRRDPGSEDELVDAAAELEVIVMHTRWQKLRTAALTVLALAFPMEAMAEAVQVMLC